MSEKEVQKEAAGTPKYGTHSDNFFQYRMPSHANMTRAESDAANVVAVAEDQLNPWRNDLAWSHYGPNLAPMKTSINEEMAKLNRDPKRLDAAIDAMEHQADVFNRLNNTDMHVKVTTDDKGNRDVTFEVPQTEHYLGEAHRFQVLSQKDEANVLDLASQLQPLPGRLSGPQLRNVANIMASYQGKEYNVDRMLTNLSVEVSPRQVGLGTYGAGTDAALAAYGVTSPTYFHTDKGRISRNLWQ
jgi:hypothetical protein